MNLISMINKRQESWNDKWGKIRDKGRLVFALTKAFYISAIITIIAFGFVYFTDYQLKISKREFAVVLFVVMFLY